MEMLSNKVIQFLSHVFLLGMPTFNIDASSDPFYYIAMIVIISLLNNYSALKLSHKAIDMANKMRGTNHEE